MPKPKFVMSTAVGSLRPDLIELSYLSMMSGVPAQTILREVDAGHLRMIKNGAFRGFRRDDAAAWKATRGAALAKGVAPAKPAAPSVRKRVAPDRTAQALLAEVDDLREDIGIFQRGIDEVDRLASCELGDFNMWDLMRWHQETAEREDRLLGIMRKILVKLSD